MWLEEGGGGELGSGVLCIPATQHTTFFLLHTRTS